MPIPTRASFSGPWRPSVVCRQPCSVPVPLCTSRCSFTQYSQNPPPPPDSFPVPSASHRASRPAVQLSTVLCCAVLLGLTSPVQSSVLWTWADFFSFLIGNKALPEPVLSYQCYLCVLCLLCCSWTLWDAEVSWLTVVIARERVAVVCTWWLQLSVRSHKISIIPSWCCAELSLSNSLLSSFPSVKSGQIRNLESARVSMVGQVKQ